jgi:hypothetical protein
VDKWESGFTVDQAGAWVISPSDGGADVKFDKASYPDLAHITGGEAVKFTRNPNDPGWAGKIVLDTGLIALTTTAIAGTTMTPAARKRLEPVLADRLFWASFLSDADRHRADAEMNRLLHGLTGAVKLQTLKDKGL